MITSFDERYKLKEIYLSDGGNKISISKLGNTFVIPPKKFMSFQVPIKNAIEYNAKEKFRNWVREGNSSKHENYTEQQKDSLINDFNGIVSGFLNNKLIIQTRKGMYLQLKYLSPFTERTDSINSNIYQEIYN